jgi:hypothetical protein
MFLCLNVTFTPPPGIASDAPALSTDQDPHSILSPAGESKISFDSNAKDADSAEHWDDEALAASTFRRNVVAVSSSTAPTAGVLDMKSMDIKRTDPDSIAEKLRVEETKAQLAAAREGMEREAAKLKEERERKEQAKLDAEKSRFGAAASAAASGTWVAPHRRINPSAPSLMSNRMSNSSANQKLDVQDEELFPDLAAADKVLEKKEKSQAPIFKIAKKTPVGAGATWASKTTTSTTTPAPALPKPSEASSNLDATKTDPVTAEPELAKESEVNATVSVPVAEPAIKKTVVKKKKKDLSTFKPGS